MFLVFELVDRTVSPNVRTGRWLARTLSGDYHLIDTDEGCQPSFGSAAEAKVIADRAILSEVPGYSWVPAPLATTPFLKNRKPRPPANQRPENPIMDDQRPARLAVPPPSLASPRGGRPPSDSVCEPDRAMSPQALNARRILALADLCLERREAMDVFAEPYRLAGRASQLALTPAFRALVTHFAEIFSALVGTVDEAEHPNAYFHPASPLTRPLDWRALIADARLSPPSSTALSASRSTCVRWPSLVFASPRNPARANRALGDRTTGSKPFAGKCRLLQSLLKDLTTTKPRSAWPWVLQGLGGSWRSRAPVDSLLRWHSATETGHDARLPFAGLHGPRSLSAGRVRPRLSWP